MLDNIEKRTVSLADVLLTSDKKKEKKSTGNAQIIQKQRGT